MTSTSGSRARISPTGFAFLAVFALAIFGLDYYFYTTRCELSPPVSALGLCLGLVFQAGAILVFASLVETQPTHKGPDTPARLSTGSALMIMLILLAVGTGISTEALTRADAMSMRGARSSADACPGAR